jgi:very-short-patch-repair endonuclease
MKFHRLPYNPRLKEVARRLRRELPPAEIAMWQRLKRKQVLGCDFDRQRPIDEYIVDFYSRELKLAVEVDGWTHDYKQAGDLRRQRRLESLGVRFLRFTDREVLANTDGVVAAVEAWITEHRGQA